MLAVGPEVAASDGHVGLGLIKRWNPNRSFLADVPAGRNNPFQSYASRLGRQNVTRLFRHLAYEDPSQKLDRFIFTDDSGLNHLIVLVNCDPVDWLSRCYSGHRVGSTRQDLKRACPGEHATGELLCTRNQAERGGRGAGRFTRRPNRRTALIRPSTFSLAAGRRRSSQSWGDSGDTVPNPREMSMVSLELPTLARPPAAHRGIDMPVRRDHNYGHNGTQAAILPDL